MGFAPKSASPYGSSSQHSGNQLGVVDFSDKDSNALKKKLYDSIME